MESTSTTEADKKTITLLKQQLNEEIESFRDKSNTIIKYKMGNSKDNSDDLKIIENKYKPISKMTDDNLILRDNQIEMN